MEKSLRLSSILLIFLIVFSFDLQAQKQNRTMKKAEVLFDLEQYFKAIDLYKKAYKKSKSKAEKAEIIFKQAECYRISGKIKQAQNYYKRAIKAKYPDVIVYLRYADVLKMLGNLEEAVNQYKKYIKFNPTDVRGEMGLKSCKFALKWQDIPTRYNVELMPVVNSRYSDFSPAFGNSDYSELYFTSSRDGGLSDKIDARTGEAFSDVWYSSLDKKGSWSRPSVMPEPINTEGNEGPLHVNMRGTVMYLTQCKVEKKKNLGCGICVSERKGKTWGATQILQLDVNDNTNLGHPALSDDEKTLFFSSDLPGGYGGKDLWVSVKEKRNLWSTPINLGPLVNTPGDEMFPFIASDGNLYFASDGHIGMGGFDIYKTSKDNYGAYILPVNLKYPINSTGDDFGMIVEQSGERGYFTSNRPGGKGGDDIYQFELPALKVSVQGIVTDAKTGAIMTGVKVNIVGSDGNAKEIITDNTGKYSFKLKPLTSYEISVDTKGYLTKIARETTEGIELDKIFLIDLALDPVKKQIVLPLITYDFNKFDLRPQSIIALDLLAEGLFDHPDVVLEIKGHTDDVGSNKQNQKLSLQRANSCIQYLISKGINEKQLVAKAMGETEPFVILEKDGRFGVGDVLTASYIKKIRFKKNREKAHQYNRRTTFNIIFKDDTINSINDTK